MSTKSTQAHVKITAKHVAPDAFTLTIGGASLPLDRTAMQALRKAVNAPAIVAGARRSTNRESSVHLYDQLEARQAKGSQPSDQQLFDLVHGDGLAHCLWSWGMDYGIYVERSGRRFARRPAAERLVAAFDAMETRRDAEWRTYWNARIQRQPSAHLRPAWLKDQEGALGIEAALAHGREVEPHEPYIPPAPSQESIEQKTRLVARLHKIAFLVERLYPDNYQAQMIEFAEWIDILERPDNPELPTALEAYNTGWTEGREALMQAFDQRLKERKQLCYSQGRRAATVAGDTRHGRAGLGWRAFWYTRSE